jgi:methylmalonyl-CoA/ethylmalonyl-CoA epimerase
MMHLRLHHVGVVVADIDRAAEQYAARFGYRAVSDKIHDGIQTAWVQLFAEESPCDVLLELVAPDGPDSKLSNALAKGAGLNHLCYASESIETDCAELRKSGMLLVQSPVSANAFAGRRIAWLVGRDGIPVELLEVDSRTSKCQASA